MNYKNITIEQITEGFNSLIKERELDENIKPDIKIVNNEEMFWVSINGNGLKLNTGRGGLKLFFDNLSDLDFMKVEWNGIVLNSKQKQELFNNIKYGK